MSGAEAVRTITLEVYVQENGIIRLENNGYAIGKLFSDAAFEDMPNLMKIEKQIKCTVCGQPHPLSQLGRTCPNTCPTCKRPHRDCGCISWEV